MRTNKRPVEPLDSLKRWLLPSLVLSGRKVPWRAHGKINQHAGDHGHASIRVLPGDGKGACSHSGPGWYELRCVSGRVKVRDWQRVVSTNDLPCRGHWAIHLEQQQATSKWECVGLNGEDGDKHSSSRMSPGRKMDGVTRCGIYGRSFQMTNKSVGITRIEGNMCVLLLKVDEGLTK